MSANFLTPNGVFSDGYGFVPKLLMRDKRLSVEAKAIYSYLSSFAGAGMTAFPSVELMLEELGMSKDRFYKHRKLLIDFGYVSIEQSKGEGAVFAKNIYVINTNTPLPCFKDTENPTTEKPYTDNPTTGNKDTNSNSFNNNSFNSNSKKVSAKKSVAKFDPIKFLQEHNVDELVINDFIAHRKNKKAINTATALNAFIREAGKAGITVQRAIEITIEKNWAGFNASWKWQDDAITIGGNQGFSGKSLSKQEQIEAHNQALLNEMYGGSNAN